MLKKLLSTSAWRSAATFALSLLDDDVVDDFDGREAAAIDAGLEEYESEPKLPEPWLLEGWFCVCRSYIEGVACGAGAGAGSSYSASQSAREVLLLEGGGESEAQLGVLLCCMWRRPAI